MILADPKTREEWLLERQNGIGGSDAACILGKNKFKSNVQLWKEKKGIAAAEDISDNPAVAYGKIAESYIRELFKLDYPKYDIEYHEYRMYANDEYPYIFATLDGELTERETGLKGVLEIKTTTIQNSGQWEKWTDRIPDNYYVQILHQLAATGWDFAILRAYIRYFKGGSLRISIRDYEIRKEEVMEEVDYLIKQEKRFYKSLESNTTPALILPEI